MTTHNPMFTVFQDGTIHGMLNAWNVTLPLAESKHQRLRAFQPVDMDPGESDFVDVQYRALSKSLVWQEGWAGMVVTDFSQGDVLQNSVPLLQDAPVMRDHSSDALDMLGIVKDSFWTESANGIKIPGIDAIYRLDKDPNDPESLFIVRKVQKGYLKGSSVCVWFDAERSHPELDAEEFYHLMGNDVNGEIVRFVVTHIRRYLETSVLIAGADPIASPIDPEFAEDREGVAASFDVSTGWSVPKRPLQIALSANPLVQENIMKEPQEEITTEEAQLEEIVDDTIIDDDLVIDDAVDEALDDDAAPVDEIIPEIEAVQPVDVAELSASVQEPRAQDLTVSEFDVMKAKVEALEVQNRALLAQSHRQTLSVWWEKLSAPLPASFEYYDIVSGLTNLSTDSTLTLHIKGKDCKVSPLAWVQMLLEEAADKMVKVPVGTVAGHAKPADESTTYQAARDEWLKLNPGKTNTDAVKALRVDRPELFK